jgi:hypothetical protein
MAKKKKKDEAPLKKKQLLKLHVQELEESLRSATEERDGLNAKLATLATSYQELEAISKTLESDHTSLVARHKSLATSEKSVTTERDALKAKLAALEKDHKALGTRHSSQDTAFKELESKHSSLVTSSKETFEKNKLLLQQLHQVQEEIEHYFHENRRLRRRVLAGGEAESLLQAETVTLGSAENTAPHLHINYTLDRARFGTKDLGRVRLRLVEHHGRPGLAVFHRHGEQPPLRHWRVSGEEDGCTFQLVVPQDEHGTDYVFSAPAGDLIFLREAARMLAVHLTERDEKGRHAAWRCTAQLFVDHLHDKIRHLTFGDVTCTEGQESEHLDFSITPAILGHYIWASISGRWRPGALVLRAPVEGAPPLSSWPRNDAGQLVEEVEFSPGSDPQSLEHREFWRSFTARDRLILDALATSLPRLAATLPGDNQNTATWLPAMKKFSARLRAEWRMSDRKYSPLVRKIARLLPR